MKPAQGPCADPTAPCHLLRRPRVNVTPTPELSDAALRRTQAAIDGVVAVAGLRQLGQVLEALRGCHVDAMQRSLDLVAHARADGVMVLGRSLLAPGERELEHFARLHAGTLAAMGFDRVRVLGCYTARGAPALQALAHLEKLMRVPVYGCIDVLDQSHYDVDGFSPQWEGLLTRP